MSFTSGTHAARSTGQRQISEPGALGPTVDPWGHEAPGRTAKAFAVRDEGTPPIATWRRGLKRQPLVGTPHLLLPLAPPAYLLVLSPPRLRHPRLAGF